MMKELTKLDYLYLEVIKQVWYLHNKKVISWEDFNNAWKKVKEKDYE